MDWGDGPEQAGFRHEVTSFVGANLSGYDKKMHAAGGGDPDGEGGWQTDRFLGGDEARGAAIAWESTLATKGWVAPHWPQAYGGAGMASAERVILKGEVPSYEASMGKAFGSETGQRIQGTGTKMFARCSTIRGVDEAYAPLSAHFTQNYYHRIPATIAGGISEIQHNIIATSGLGLPRG